MRQGWIGVDLDGVLAYEGPKWKGTEFIGHIIPVMKNRVLRWLREGKEVRCFTARIHNDPPAARYVRDWLDHNGLEKVGMTCVKDQDLMEYWDDRAVSVERNTGRVLGRNKVRGLPCRN
jgi:hypothetical protein